MHHLILLSMIHTVYYNTIRCDSRKYFVIKFNSFNLCKKKEEKICFAEAKNKTFFSLFIAVIKYIYIKYIYEFRYKGNIDLLIFIDIFAALKCM